MKKLLLIFVLFTLTAAIPATAMTNIQYVVKNTTGSTITNGIYSIPINPTSLAANGFISSSGLNETIQGQATNVIPFNAGANVGTSYLGYVASINAGEERTHTLYLGTSGAEILNNFQYFPGATGIVTPDSALIEPGDTFEIDQAGHFVFDGLGSYTKALLYKEGTLEISSRSVGELTSAIYGTAITSTQVPVSPDIVNGSLFGSYTGTGCASLTTYGCFNNGNASYATKPFNIGGTATTTLTLDQPVLGTGEIVNVVASVDYRNNGGTTALVTLAGNSCTVVNDGAWHTCAFQLSGVHSTRPTSIIITAIKSTNTSVDLSNLNVVTTYYPVTASITATGLTNGFHRIQTVADGSLLKVYIDTVQNGGSAGPTTTQDTGTDWNFVNGGSTIYMDYTRETISGVQELDYAYKNITSSNVFPDNEGNIDGVASIATPNASLTVTTLPLVITSNTINSNNISQPDAVSTGNASLGATDQSVSSTSGFFLDPLVQVLVSVPVNGQKVPALLIYYIAGIGLSLAAMIFTFIKTKGSITWTCLAVVMVGVLFKVIGAFPIAIPAVEIFASIVLIYFDGKGAFVSAG